jgi:F0F1-type ATP synthase membrane subunit b/b'
METLIAPVVNLVILLAVMAYYLKQPLKTFAKDRHHSIRTDLEVVRNQLRDAKAKHAEFSSKLRAMDAEIAGLKTQASQDAQALKTKVQAEAQKLSSNIIEDAKHASQVLYAEFKVQLYSELGGHVLDRAEKVLRERLTGDDRARIRKEFSTQVETLQ